MLGFFLMVGMTAMMCRMFFSGDETPKETRYYFRSIGRSMFTVFRCSFGDCNTKDGVSIIEDIVGSRPPEIAFLCEIGFAGFTFFVNMGIFNVVSAIFVDSIIASETQEAQTKMVNRLEDED